MDSRAVKDKMVRTDKTEREDVALYWGAFLVLVRADPATVAEVEMAALEVPVEKAGMAGTVVDSFLGATVEDRWPGVGKGFVNFVCTLAGALVAAALTTWCVV